MKAIFPLVLLISLSVFLHGEVEDGVIEKLISELSSDSFKVREKATSELWKLSDKALPLLTKASLSDDPEQAFRAAEVLEKVGLRITPNTPDKILSLIESYRKATTNKKSEIIKELEAEKAFFQILKLYSLELPEAKRELAMSVKGVAAAGARHAILEDDLETAIELFKVSQLNYEDLMALASLYRNAGQLDEQLANLESPEGVKKEVWKNILLRAKGDFEGALAHAGESELMRQYAGLKLISGDPVLWLQQNGGKNSRQQAQQAYNIVALKQWNGERVTEVDYQPFMRQLEEKDREVRAYAMSSLAALGKQEEIEKIGAKENPFSAFVYFLSKEDVSKALSAIGLDPDAPDYRGWVKERFERATNEHAKDSTYSELVMLAGFLERRGSQKELENAFSEALVKLAKKDKNEFLNLLKMFFKAQVGAPDFAAGEAAKWAGEDKKLWDEVFLRAMGGEEIQREWLDWVWQINPKMSQREALDTILAIFKISTKPRNLREEWMLRVWEVIADEPNEAQKNIYLKRVLTLCESQKDVRNSLKAWEMLGADKRSSLKWGIDNYLVAVGRWKDVAEILEKADEGMQEYSPVRHAYLAVINRRAGFEKRAKIHDVLADKLSLGRSPTCVSIAGVYVYGGDFKKASMWYQRAVMQADVSNGEFNKALVSLVELSMREKNWKVAASCQEAISQGWASQEYNQDKLPIYGKMRLTADLARAMSILPQKKEKAVEILKSIHRKNISDGILANDFFPLLREAGLVDELESWFNESWDIVTAAIENYPECHNSRNTAAWFASRAMLKLDEAEKYLEGAIELSPESAAYLDTMAELKFAQGDRKAALEWSERSLCFAPFDLEILIQNDRFRNSPLPSLIPKK